jgi:hypothetical protein
MYMNAPCPRLVFLMMLAIAEERARKTTIKKTNAHTPVCVVRWLSVWEKVCTCMRVSVSVCLCEWGGVHGLHTLFSQSHYYTSLHYTILNQTTLHYTTLHNTHQLWQPCHIRRSNTRGRPRNWHPLRVCECVCSDRSIYVKICACYT